MGTYNAEPWITKVLHSLESQDCDPFQVVIVDNASTDNTVEIIENTFKEYALKNSYQLVRNFKNIGAISSFLDRLSFFDSEWIVMIHQDDHYHKNHISNLVAAMSEVTEKTGVIFSAMKRIDQNDTVIFNPPTLSSKLSETDRFRNVLLSLQISPINFPACALKKSILEKVDTTRHTTAFNDMELLLRMMCISDIKYLPIETMHYRVYEGNSSNTTTNFSNDRAVLIGLNEFLHSSEFRFLLDTYVSEEKVSDLISALENAIEIRMSDTELKIILANLIAEFLIREFGYENEVVNKFLRTTLEKFNLPKETKLVDNLKNLNQFEVQELRSQGSNPFSKIDLATFSKEKSGINTALDSIPLSTREKIYNSFFTSMLLKSSKRPFIKVWRKTEND